MGRIRGRPPVDDSVALARIADLLVSGEAKSPRSAIAQTVGPADSTIRRLQRKWRSQKNKLLDEARERQEAEIPHSHGIGFPHPAIESVLEIARQAHRHTDQVREIFKHTDELRRAMEREGSLRRMFEQSSRLEQAFRQALGPLEELRRAQASIDPFRGLLRK